MSKVYFQEVGPAVTEEYTNSATGEKFTGTHCICEISTGIMTKKQLIRGNGAAARQMMVDKEPFTGSIATLKVQPYKLSKHKNAQTLTTCTVLILEGQTALDALAAQGHEPAGLATAIGKPKVATKEPIEDEA
jgi:hypothetical protein